MPIARSKPPVPPNTSLLFGHNATALLPHRASYRRNIRLRIGQRAYSDRLLGELYPDPTVMPRPYFRCFLFFRRRFRKMPSPTYGPLIHSATLVTRCLAALGARTAAISSTKMWHCRFLSSRSRTLTTLDRK